MTERKDLILLPLHYLLEDLIIEQSVRYAKQSGWIVLSEDCHIVGIAANTALHTVTPYAWEVYMSVQPYYNPSLQRPFRLIGRVELLGDCLCCVNVQRPADHRQRVI